MDQEIKMPLVYQSYFTHDDDDMMMHHHNNKQLLLLLVSLQKYIYVLLFGDEKKINHYARTISDIEYIDDCIYRYTDMLNQNIVT